MPTTPPQMTPEAYCAAQVKQSRSSFRLGFLLLSRERRQAIHALYAFCREVDDIVDDLTDLTDLTDTAEARKQLDGWRREIQSLYRGSPGHPISAALLPAIRNYSLSENHFLAILDGMEMDLEKGRYANFEELYLYCYRAAGVVGLLAARIFGFQDPHTEEYAEALGIALQLTNILRDVGEDLQRGRIYLPQDELAQYSLSEASLNYPENGARLKPLFDSLRMRAEGYYQKALNTLPAIDRKSQLSGLVMGAIYHELLNEIAREGYPVLTKRVHLSAPRKVWAALKYLLTRDYG